MPLRHYKIILFLGIIILHAVACEEPVQSVDRTRTVFLEPTNNGYRLIRNNEPFYIKGGGGTEFLEELKTAGGNTVRTYDTIDLQNTLDKAHALGLAVVVDIPLPQYDPRFDFYEQDLTQLKTDIRDLVSKYKDHPALLYWMLGNELFYPTFYTQTKFFDHFNDLIDTIHKVDPNHPVSTALIGNNRRRLSSVIMKSPALDFVSVNSFGNLTNLQERMKTISLLWDGPYVISEWGINGPWEEAETTWGAPIEPTSTKKAELLRERYHTKAMTDPNCLGSIAFYWGNKQERTHTWFSFFSETGGKTHAYHEVSNLWNSDTTEFMGPEINYTMINGKGAPSSIILSSGQRARAETFFLSQPRDSLQVTWEIRKESWADILERKPPINNLFMESDQSKAAFVAPVEEGPYRLFYYATDTHKNFATANVPFYVLNARNEE